MNGNSRRRGYLSVIAMLGLLTLVGLPSGFAQSNADLLKQKVLSGGSYQVIDTAVAPCSGQCVVANWQTLDCTCPPNFTPVISARMLVSVGEGQEGSVCGATLVSCVVPLPQP